jgi:hypothetical protein
LAHASSIPSARRATNHGCAFGVGVGESSSAVALVLGVDDGDVGATLVVFAAPVVAGDTALDDGLVDAPAAAGEAVVPTAPRVGAGVLADVGDPPQARRQNTGSTDTHGVTRRPVERGEVVMLV